VGPGKDFTLTPGGDGILKVSGALNIGTVTRIRQASLDYFHDAASVPRSIELTEVTSADSAGLALLIEWLRLGKQQNCTIKYMNLPAQMLPLARLFGVDHLLHQPVVNT